MNPALVNPDTPGVRVPIMNAEPSAHVLVCMPCYGPPEFDCMRSLVEMVHCTMRLRPDIKLSFNWINSHPLAGCVHCYEHLDHFPDARNRFAYKAINMGCTHRFMMDSDMSTEEPTLLLNLINAKVDIIGALYARRDGSGVALASRRNKKGEYKAIPVAELPRPIAAVDALGTGAILITTRCLKGMKHPWFSWQVVNGMHLGEDTNFCRLAKEAGFQPYIDPTVRVAHIKERALI